MVLPPNVVTEISEVGDRPDGVLYASDGRFRAEWIAEPVVKCVNGVATLRRLSIKI